MQVESSQKIDVWLLLCHESSAVHSFDDWELEKVLNQRLLELQYDMKLDGFDVKLRPPVKSGLDRWIVEWQQWAEEEPQGIRERVYTPQEARDKLPSGVVSLLDALNKTKIVLSPE